ncbi:ABC transporter substrate-binding protein [uncultured Sphaerochaeta sp.]|uniref:ABC transporter substrate-binding protein n=1 Tax=uncultured Sphaerochaeta sp. TaxID=886478 RepID=UPI002A0A8B17|nr:ABC transporter substrate-binding protein [uncultured Sphaerochaeta sp.]
MKHSVRTTILLLAMIVALVLPAFANGTVEAPASGTPSYKIGVSKLLAHPALDAAEKGMQDYLATTGLDVSYDLQNANGDISTAASIAQKFKSDKVDVAVGIATPSAQALANVFDTTPVVYSAVTDPVEAGLVADNICGVSDSNPVEAQIKLLVQITGAKTVGNIYASGEANGVVLMEMAKKACENLGVEFVSAAISNSSEVKMATQSIIGRVDAIYVATDNAVISALASVDDVCTKAGKTLLCADPSGIDGLNCMIAWGFNYYSIGVATGKVVEKAIKGESPKSIGTVYLTDPADFELWFNLDTAKKLGYTIPQSLQDTAAVLIKDGKKIIQK